MHNYPINFKFLKALERADVETLINHDAKMHPNTLGAGLYHISVVFLLIFLRKFDQFVINLTKTLRVCPSLSGKRYIPG